MAQEEIKTIFGSIPDIYEVHTKIKVGRTNLDNGVVIFEVPLLTFVCFYQNDLEELLTDWSENQSVGNIFLKYVSVRCINESKLLIHGALVQIVDVHRCFLKYMLMSQIQ